MIPPKKPSGNKEILIPTKELQETFRNSHPHEKLPKTFRNSDPHEEVQKKTLRNSDPRAEVQETFRNSDPIKSPKTFRNSVPHKELQKTFRNHHKKVQKHLEFLIPIVKSQKKKHSEILVLKENTKKIRNSVPH